MYNIINYEFVCNMNVKHKTTRWLFAKPSVKHLLADLLGIVGKKARFICYLNTGFPIKLELNT